MFIYRRLSTIVDICPLSPHNSSMRLQNPLDDIFGSRTKVRILRLLFETRGMFSGREVSRLIGFSPTHTISNLRELETLGLVIRQRAGNTDLYQLDEQNSAVRGVLTPVFRWEESLFEELAGMFVNKLGEELVSIRVFGSTARGEEKPDSDVDLALVVVGIEGENAYARYIFNKKVWKDELESALGQSISMVRLIDHGKPEILAGIARDGVLLYERPSE